MITNCQAIVSYKLIHANLPSGAYGGTDLHQQAVVGVEYVVRQEISRDIHAPAGI